MSETLLRETVYHSPETRRHYASALSSFPRPLTVFLFILRHRRKENFPKDTGNKLVSNFEKGPMENKSGDVLKMLKY